MPETRILTNAETARVMRKVLSPDGDSWCKGEYKDLHGRRCLVGAWMYVPFDIMALTGAVDEKSFNALARIIREQFPERVSNAQEEYSNDVIITFNDHADTVYEDIVAVLEKLEASE